MATIPGCVNSDQPKCGKVNNWNGIWGFLQLSSRLENVVFSEAALWCRAANEAFDGNVEVAKLVLERCFTRKDSMHAQCVAARSALIKIEAIEHDAMVALLKCSGQTQLFCDVTSIYCRFNATPR
jgi:hypothetical protein